MPGGPPPRWLDQAAAGARERGSHLVGGTPGNLPVMTLVVTLPTAIVASVGFLDPHLQAALRDNHGPAVLVGLGVATLLRPGLAHRRAAASTRLSTR
jgi:hypothetical protein